MLLAILPARTQFLTIDFHKYFVVMVLTHTPNSHVQETLSVLTETLKCFIEISA